MQKTYPLLVVGLLLLLNPVPAVAFELDFDKEVLHIPETHETDAYIRDVPTNPDDYRLQLKKEPQPAEFSLLVSHTDEATIDEVHVFVTDADFEHFSHIFARKKEAGRYGFAFDPPEKDEYRFEMMLKTTAGWVKSGETMDLEAAPGQPASEIKDRSGYEVIIRKFPPRIYVDHVATLVFEIIYNDTLVTDLEPIHGSEIHLAAWSSSFFTRFGRFTYAAASQNLGGPEAGVSLVFKDNGRHKVFATFKHRGQIRTVETEFKVFLEPERGFGKIYQVPPAVD